jgi:hypothetical protein
VVTRSPLPGDIPLRALRGLLAIFLLVPPAAQAQRPDRNVVLIMLDGLRWQEVFSGADSLLIHSDAGGIGDSAATRRQFWRGTPMARRHTLLPFIWDTISVRGQVLGDAARGSVVRVTNGLNFSYPGYNEVLAGRPDPRINANDYPPNPNVTVFEWLATRPGFDGKVAAFGTWDAFPRIFNRERAKVHLWAGWEEPFPDVTDSTRRLMNELSRTTTRIWDDLSYDAFMQVLVRDYVKREKPRVLFIGYGETDVWAHDGKYDKLLRSAQQTDRFIAELWALMQAMPRYRGKTTFIITTDHGRGDGPQAWRDHGKDVAGSENTWMAVIGPDTPAGGARVDRAAVTAGQLAATIAALLGEDFLQGSPEAAPPIAELLGK